MIIYKATSKTSKKCYIGQTINNLNSRKNAHKWASLSDKPCNFNTKFNRAIRKYGFEDFKWEIIYECNDIDELNKIEQSYIKKYNSMKNGYNTLSGGKNYTRSKEFNEGYKGKNNPMYGISREQRFINKYGKKIGKIKYIEYKTKIYKTLSKNNSGKNNGMWGKSPYDFMTEEQIKNHKKNISNAHMGLKMSEETKQKISDTKKAQKRIFTQIIKDKELLIKLYFTELYSIPMLLKYFNTTKSTIKNSFNYHNLKFRSMKEQTIITNKLKRNRK